LLMMKESKPLIDNTHTHTLTIRRQLAWPARDN
jgi:hypothetical protein